MVNQVTLASFIKHECCNFVSDGCLGVDFSKNLFNPGDVCFVLKDRKPCKFFEDCVLEVAKHRGCFDRVFGEYQDINLSISSKGVRRCECGSELLKRERYCEKCRKKKRLEAKRRNWHKHEVLD